MTRHTMLVKAISSVVALLVWIAPQALHARVPRQCTAALVTNVSNFSSDYLARYSVAELLDQQTFNESSLSGSFGAVLNELHLGNSFEQVEQERRSFRRQFSADASTYDHRAYLISYLSPDGARAFSTCMREQNQIGLAVWVEQAEPTLANVVVRWVQPPGTTSTVPLSLQFVGGEAQGPVPNSVSGVFNLVVPVQRAAGEDLRIIANAGGYTASFLLPHHKEFREVTDRIAISSLTARPEGQPGEGWGALSQADAGGCFGRRCSGEGAEGNRVCIAPPPGYVFRAEPTAQSSGTSDEGGVGTSSDFVRRSPHPRGLAGPSNWQTSEVPVCYAAVATPSGAERRVRINGSFVVVAERMTIQPVP